MYAPLNLYIDHTLLRPDATDEEIKKLCQEGIEYQFGAVCLHPTWTLIASEFLKGSSVKLCSVVGFPLGANTTKNKAQETQDLVHHGVEEIDMVINIGALKSKDYKLVEQDIKEVVRAASSKAIVKVILETCLLSDEEKKIACHLTVQAGAHFVKTSTGFSKAGATIHDVALMRSAVGPEFGVKASGGVRDLAGALAMIEAGATRIGTSSGVAICLELSASNKTRLYSKNKGGSG